VGDNDGTVASTSAVVGPLSLQVIADSPQVADEVPVAHSGHRSTPTFDNSPPSTLQNHSDTPDMSGPAVERNVPSELSAVTPESIRPLPKAGPRKAGVARKKLSSEIITSTPVKKGLWLNVLNEK